MAQRKTVYIGDIVHHDILEERGVVIALEDELVVIKLDSGEQATVPCDEHIEIIQSAISD